LSDRRARRGGDLLLQPWSSARWSIPPGSDGFVFEAVLVLAR